MSREFALSLVGIGLVGTGAWALFFQGHYAAWHERRYQARLADRLVRGEDSYFEELRELQAYPPQRFSRPQQKIGGALAMLGGLVCFALSFGSGQ
ncbi:MAG TPA: hypothetical protein VEW04_02855 [Allosphingosinicella sp.]|nr:hypothetical protein [Allosphingosinicella sp.]